MKDMNIEKALDDFCRSITGANPVSLPHLPESWARTNYCFANVKRKVDEAGGGEQLGWQFTQLPVGKTPGVLSAIHHAVWVSPEGELIDITPCVAMTLKSDTGILFLPDETATVPRPIGYEVGVSRPRKFFPIGRTAKVKKLVEAARLKERAYWERVLDQLA